MRNPGWRGKETDSEWWWREQRTSMLKDSGGDLSNFLPTQIRKPRLEGQRCFFSSIHPTPTQIKIRSDGGGGQWGAGVLTDMVAAPDSSSG